MSSAITINKNNVHLWHIFLPSFFADTEDFFLLLSDDEKERANRFKFEIHKQRFIISRGVLRKILSLYLANSPSDIRFSYEEKGKPFLSDNALKFNVSHSEDRALIALTLSGEIGIDIEKIKLDFNENVAKRFFTKEEYDELMNLPVNKRHVNFYQIWTKKEAVIKALGQGLYTSLNSFSVSLQKNDEIVLLNHDQKKCEYHLHAFTFDTIYQCALATELAVNSIEAREWN